MRKRSLSLLLAGCVLFGVTPFGGAAEPEEALAETACQEGCSLTPGHGGECVLHQAGWQNEEEGPWQYGSLAEALHKVESGGTVKLMKDFYVTGSTGIPSITKPMTLTSADPEAPCKLTCGINGHPSLLMISSEACVRNIIIDGGKEEGLVANGPLVVVQNGSLTLGEGACIRNNRNNNNSRGTNWLGGGVFLSGTMTMEEGSSIQNCRAWAGGGVAVVNNSESCLTLRGGNIEDCESYQGGGVNVVWGSLVMENGQIANCRAVEPESQSLLEFINTRTELNSPGEGGGVFLCWENQSVLEMGGGGIRNNHAAASGGGVGCDGGILKLSGGEVTGNTAEDFGGGIFGSPDLRISLSGAFTVADNTAGSGEGCFHNFYLDATDDDFPEGEHTDPTRPITIAGPLEEEIYIGITRWLRPDKEEEHPYRVVATPGEGYTITRSDREKFVSDDPRFVILLREGNVVITFAELTHTVTYTDGAEGSAFADAVNEGLLPGDETPDFSGTPVREGYRFQGWEPEVAQRVTGDAVYTARWKKKASPWVPLPTPTPEPTPSVSPTPVPEPEPSAEPTPTPTPVPPPEEPEEFPLETKDHFAYIVGYDDGTVRPLDNIARSEVAAIFFRLMREDFRQDNWATENSFTDVEGGEWYNNAVSTAAQAGLLQGCDDGAFHGERSITRGEFAVIAARFDSEEYHGPDLFSDISGHWGVREINRAAQKGWIQGYPDGTFRPDAPITRAEAVTLVNRMLRRFASEDGLLEDMRRWPDNQEGEWYYLDVQEATNGHTYDRDGTEGTGIWTGLTEDRDWTELER